MNAEILMVLDVLAKSLGVLLFAAALQSLWRRASAAQRCLVWLGAFTVLLLLPLTMIMKPVWTVSVPGGTAPPPVLHELPLIQSMPVISEDNLAPLPPPVAEPFWQMPQLSVWQWLGLAWLAGVFTLLLRRVAGAWQLRRLYKENFACETPHICALASRLATDLGVRRRVDLRLSSKVTVPLTWGFFKPVLLLPADAREWQEAPLHAALCHELGHIRHWDALSRLLMSLLCALQWPNALLWLAAKSWRTAQEQACDDLVLNSGASKEAYAMQLLESARSVQRLGFLHAALTMAQASTLETRLSAIMDLKRDRRPMRRGALFAGLAFAFSLLLLCAALQLRAEGPSRVTLDAGNLHLTCDEFHFNDLARQTGTATGHVIVNVTRDDGAPSPIHEGKADEVEFDLGKKQAILRGHPEILMGASHRHYGTADDTKMIIHWDGSHIRTDTHGPAKTEILPGAPAPVMPLTNAVGVESPFKNVQITAKQTHFDPVRNIATAKGQVEVTVTTNGNPPAIYRGKADALEYDTVKKEVALHGHAEIADSATGDFLSFDDKDVIIKWDTPKGSWQLRMPKTTDTGGGEKPQTSQQTHDWVAESTRKMQRIIFPTVQFKENTVEESIEFLRVKSKELDTAETRANFKGVNIILLQGAPAPTARITLDLHDVPLVEALHYVTELAGLKYKVEPYAVIVGEEKRLAGLGVPIPFDNPVQKPAPVAPGTRFYSVAGQVKRPDLYPLTPHESLTIREALRRAGGPTDRADVSKIRWVHEALGGKKLDLDVDGADGTIRDQYGIEILVQPGDVIVVHEKGSSGANQASMESAAAFTVVGEVVRQGKYELKPNEHIMVSEAIQRAGGPTAFADMKSVHVIRPQSKEGPRTNGGKDINITTTFSEVPPDQFGFEILIGPGDTIKVDKQGENPNSHQSFPQRPKDPLLAQVGHPVTTLVRNGNTLNFVALAEPPQAAAQTGQGPLPNVASGPSSQNVLTFTTAVEAPEKSAARAKADHIIIPTVLFKEAKLDEALEFLRVKSKALDPDGKGVNILLNVGPQSSARAARLTMELKNIPLSEALRYVAGLANLEIKADDGALILQEPKKKDTASATAGALDFTGGSTIALDGGTLVFNHATAPSPVLTKANQIILPTVSFREATLEQALDFLRAKSKELDPAKEGVNIVLKAGPKAHARDARLTMELKNIPLSDALRYVAELADLELDAEDHAMILREKAAVNVARLADVKVIGFDSPDSPTLDKAKKIILPQVDFETNSDVDAAISFLRHRAKELDPDKEGVKIILNMTPGRHFLKGSLNLKNAPLSEALRYVAYLVQFDIRVDDKERAIILQQGVK